MKTKFGGLFETIKIWKLLKADNHLKKLFMTNWILNLNTSQEELDTVLKTKAESY